MAAEAIPPFSGAREETLYVCGQTPPAHHVLRLNLRDLVGWLALIRCGRLAYPFLATGPLIAALIVIPLTQGRAGLRELGSRMIRWQVGWIWWALAIGLPLGVHLVTAGLNVAAGAGVPSLAFGSVTTFLLMFAVRMVNPLDGPLGEEPGWRAFALPG